MKHLFIINPIAGGKRHDPENTVRLVEEAMSGRNERYEIFITKAPEDACSKIDEDAQIEHELRVYGCGGDGTLNECVNGACGHDNVSVTQYPCGTGNDFLRMFGDGSKFFSDISALVDGDVHKLDLIRVNGKYCVNICSVGIDARVGTDVHKYDSMPLLGNKAGYLISTAVNVFKGINSRFTVKTDGIDETGDYALICACNGRYYGGGFNPVPDARPDDGYMDVLITSSVKLTALPTLLGKYAKGQYRELTKYIRHIKTKKIRISADNDFVVNIDGEAMYTDKVEFEILPGILNFICPKSVKFWN